MSEALKPDDFRDALRKVGGLLFGLGFVMIFLRKGQDWGDFALFLTLGVPAVLLFGVGTSTARAAGEVRPWQAVFTIFGLLLIPFAIGQLVDVVGDSGSDLNVFWIFGLTAALGVYAGHLVGVRFALLVSCVAAIVSWTSLWDKLLGDEGVAGHIGTYRGLLGLLAILLVIAGIRIWRDERDEEEGLRKFSEFLTGAGIAAVLGCSLGVTALLTLFPIPFVSGFAIGDSTLWDVLLLAVSLGLVGLGTTIGVRGPAYVGAIGLGLFALIVGLDLNEAQPDPSNLGLWPILLLVGGGLAFFASLSERVSLGDAPRDWIRRISGR